MAYHSKFGDLWIDDTDIGTVAEKLALIADPVMRERVDHLHPDAPPLRWLE